MLGCGSLEQASVLFAGGRRKAGHIREVRENEREREKKIKRRKERAASKRVRLFVHYNEGSLCTRPLVMKVILQTKEIKE